VGKSVMIQQKVVGKSVKDLFFQEKGFKFAEI